MNKKSFKFRNKKEAIGVLLGSICFVPSFLIAFYLNIFNSTLLGIIVLIISQCLWLTSISLCYKSLETENRKLKKMINKKNYEGE